MVTASEGFSALRKVTKAAKILVVEDEAIVAEDIASRLQRLGYQVIGPVNAGYDCLDLAEKTSPDLVLLDITLRGPLDGVETAEQISRRFNLPVVFLTAHGDQATFARARSAGPRGYVLKPFSESDLFRGIELALGQQLEVNRLAGDRNRLVGTLRSMADALLTTDGNCRVVMMNSAAEALLGLTEAEATGRKLTEVVVYEQIDRREPVLSALPEALRLDHVVSNPTPLRIRSNGGLEYIVEECAMPVHDEHGKPIGGLVTLHVLADPHAAVDERMQLMAALRTSLQSTAVLRSLVPVCAWCKRIHAAEGQWKTIEEMLVQAGEMRISHGICPSCASKFAAD